jgi:DNA-directed RNA polymerase subunit E'/Rpb7
MKTHELKIKQIYAIDYYDGNKPWELRKNDRDFKVGDTINFTIIETGFKYSRDIIFIFKDAEYGLEKGYCILTLSGYKYYL